MEKTYKLNLEIILSLNDDMIKDSKLDKEILEESFKTAIFDVRNNIEQLDIDLGHFTIENINVSE